MRVSCCGRLMACRTRRSRSSWAWVCAIATGRHRARFASWCATGVRPQGTGSQRCFWKLRPDDVALGDPSLEVVLSDSAALTELEGALLAPGVLPGLWEKEPLTLEVITRYFSGTHFVSVDKGGYTENQVIPSASPDAIRVAVIAAVKLGRVWLVNGTIGLLGEDVTVGFVNEQAGLFSPPPLLAATELLPTVLASHYDPGQVSAAQGLSASCLVARSAFLKPCLASIHRALAATLRTIDPGNARRR